jgi:hypothetical protein
MACVTLKRSLDLDPLEALHSPNRPPKRRRCTPLKNVDRDSSSSLSCQTSFPSPSSEPSVFREQSPLSPSEIANYLRDELKRLRKRRQLAEPYPTSARSPPASPGSPEPMMADSTASDRASPSGVGITHQQAAGSVASAAHLAQPGPSSSKSSANVMQTKISKGDRPVFTLKQMTMICEKMCKERTDQVREEYDQILQQKLSEQYDAFVKFVDHQIQQRFNQSQLPSYLS